MKSHITIVDMTYYRAEGEQPIVVSSRFGRDLQTTEQPYIRRVTITEKWEQLQLGWIQQCGLLILAVDPPSYKVQPTPEERNEAESKVVEVIWNLDNPQWGIRIPPGEDARFQPIYRIPETEFRLYARCLNGQTKLTVHAFSI